jgi:hypothetical protein
LPLIHTELHKPRCRRVPESVGANTIKPRMLGGRLECGLHRFDGLSVPFHEVFTSNPLGVPPPEVSKQALRNGNGRLALVGLALAPSQSVEDSILEIDERTTCAGRGRSGGNRSGARPSVKPNEYEPREMTQRILGGDDSKPFVSAAVPDLLFPVAPADHQQLGCLAASQPPLTRQAFRRQHHVNDTAVKALLGMVVDGRPQVFQVSPGASVAATPSNVFSAGNARDFGQLQGAPKLVKTTQALVEFCLVRLKRAPVLLVDREDVSYSY